MSTTQEPSPELSGLNRDQIRAMRRSYGEIGLSEADVTADPITLFESWLDEASRNPVTVEANAMILSSYHKQALSLPIDRNVYSSLLESLKAGKA